jgi:uncharacterized protein (DUF2235 family)
MQIPLYASNGVYILIHSLIVFSAYELYANPTTDEPTETEVGSDEVRLSMAERFKSAFSHPDVKVHFVGAWYALFTLSSQTPLFYSQEFRDTVSSIGAVRGKYILPRTIDGMKHVCFFRHALALDERRVKFLPEYACGGKSENPLIVNYESPDEISRTVGDGFDKDDIPSLKNEGSQIQVDNTGAVNRLQDRTVTATTGKRPHTMEVWFAGTHSDM